jgi:hypothetical protein
LAMTSGLIGVQAKRGMLGTVANFALWNNR